MILKAANTGVPPFRNLPAGLSVHALFDVFWQFRAVTCLASWEDKFSPSKFLFLW